MKEILLDRRTAEILAYVLLISQIKSVFPSTVSRTLSSSDSGVNEEHSPYPKNVQNWYGVDSKNITCIKLHGALRIKFGINETSWKEDVPITAVAAVQDGSCDEYHQFIELHWQSQTNNSIDLHLSLYFEKEETKYVFNASTIEWGGKGIEKGNHHIDYLNEFETSLDHSYKCLAESSVQNTFSIYFSDLQFQAFHSFDKETPFSKEDDCDLFKDMGKRLVEMMALLFGSLLVLFILALVLYKVLTDKCQVQFGYHSVN